MFENILYAPSTTRKIPAKKAKQSTVDSANSELNTLVVIMNAKISRKDNSAIQKISFFIM